jgi:hypothetical protein
MIPACTVTSSAVVGSSAIRRLGLPARAIAIATRWRMPPENWCGNARSALSGSGMRTASRSSAACRFAAERPSLRWIRKGSPSCWPIESMGWSDVIGSWKTIPMSRPHTARSSDRRRRSRSRPPKCAWPSAAPPAGSSPSSASTDIVFPLPLSPATPNTSAGCTS